MNVINICRRVFPLLICFVFVFSGCAGKTTVIGGNESIEESDFSSKDSESPFDLYQKSLNEKTEAKKEIIKKLFDEGETEYMGREIPKEKEYIDYFAWECAWDELDMETFEMVQGYGYAEDIEKPMVFSERKKERSGGKNAKWRKQFEYLNDCYELFCNVRLTDYEVFLIWSTFALIPGEGILSNPEVSEMRDKAHEQYLEINRSVDEMLKKYRQ